MLMTVGKEKLFIIAVVCLAIVYAAERAPAEERKWTIEDVQRGITSSIALDEAQNLHIAYLANDARVYYGFRARNSTRWFTLSVVPSSVTHGTKSIYPRVTTDSSNLPHICVLSGTLSYITSRGGHWVMEEVDAGSGTLSYHCSVAIAGDGRPHLTWYHEFLPGGKQYTHMRHASMEEGVWVVRSVDGGISGKWNAMAIDSKGVPHVSYSQWSTNGGLRYAVWDGTGWSIAAVDSGNEIGYDNDLVLSSDGTPHISYFDQTTLKHAYQKDQKWVIENVAVVRDGYDFYGATTAMLLDSKGRPHIVFGDFGAVKEASWDGTKWETQVIASGGVQQYFNVSAVMGPDDTLYVSYPDPEDGMVKVATGKIMGAATTAKSTGTPH